MSNCKHTQRGSPGGETADGSRGVESNKVSPNLAAMTEEIQPNYRFRINQTPHPWMNDPEDQCDDIPDLGGVI